MRWTVVAACAACLLAGCYRSHGVADEGSPSVPPDPPDARDSGSMPALPTCPPAALLGAVTSVERAGAHPSIAAFEGCDGACVAVYDREGPRLDADVIDLVREELASFHEEELELGPCCPSRGEASGVCVIAREEVELTDGSCYPGMWLVGASWVLPGARGCVGVRVETP